MDKIFYTYFFPDQSSHMKRFTVYIVFSSYYNNKKIVMLYCLSVNELQLHKSCNFHVLTCFMFWQASDHCSFLFGTSARHWGLYKVLLCWGAQLSMLDPWSGFGRNPGFSPPTKCCAYIFSLAFLFSLLEKRH